VIGTHVRIRYFRNEEETQRAIKDGWFCTGDIGERLSNGSIRIIDRRKHIFKLAQGEFVAPERLVNAPRHDS
jgi:long-chain acyl-CoA synthetase